MDARTFEPDEPLPRVCKHCAWGKSHIIAGRQPVVMCQNHTATRNFAPVTGVGLLVYPTSVNVPPDHTCDHWEERK